MRSYAELDKVLRGATDYRKAGVVIKPHTRVVESLFSDYLAIRLYHTDILLFWQNGSIVLDSDGYRTQLTKERMNDHLPDGWEVKQRSNVWYLVRETFGICATIKEYIFEDGIRIGPRGGCDGKLRSKKKEKKKDSLKPHPIDGWKPLLL